MSLLYVYKSLRKGSSLFVRYHHNAHYSRANNLSVTTPQCILDSFQEGHPLDGGGALERAAAGDQTSGKLRYFQTPSLGISANAAGGGILTPGGCGYFGSFCGEPLS